MGRSLNYKFEGGYFKYRVYGGPIEAEEQCEIPIPEISHWQTKLHVEATRQDPDGKVHYTLHIYTKSGHDMSFPVAGPLENYNEKLALLKKHLSPTVEEAPRTRYDRLFGGRKEEE